MTEYQTCVSILFVGYILGQLPSNMFITRTRPSRYMVHIPPHNPNTAHAPPMLTYTGLHDGPLGHRQRPHRRLHLLHRPPPHALLPRPYRSRLLPGRSLPPLRLLYAQRNLYPHRSPLHGQRPRHRPRGAHRRGHLPRPGRLRRAGRVEVAVYPAGGGYLCGGRGGIFLAAGFSVDDVVVEARGEGVGV